MLLWFCKWRSKSDQVSLYRDCVKLRVCINIFILKNRLRTVHKILIKKKIQNAIKTISWKRFGSWMKSASNGILTLFHHHQATGPSELTALACSLAPWDSSSAVYRLDMYEGWCPDSRCLLDWAAMSKEFVVSSCPSWCSAAGSGRRADSSVGRIWGLS